MAPGAHEAKEHASECHYNPNYVITFGLNWLLSRAAYMVSNNEIVVSLYGNQLDL